jgi:HK97 family phage portal protein
MSEEQRVLSELVWTPDRGLEEPEVRGIAWDNFLLSDERYLGKWKTDSGIRVTPETALQSTVVLACCRILSETISGLPLHIYRKNGDGTEEIDRDVPLNKILCHSPNEWQTKQEFFEQIVMNLTLWGNSYTRIRSGLYGSVSCLDNLHPSRMDVTRLENGRLKYSYTDPESGMLEHYRMDHIMHIRWTPEQDGIKGMVPVEIAREAIGLARACEQHAARFWANSARPGVVLQTDGTLTAEAAERLRENWERLHRGSDRAYRTAILTGGLKAQELGMTNESSQFVATRAAQCEEIARVYRIPQHLIQGTPGGDLEVQGQEFITYTLMPWINRIESAISRSLIINSDEFHAKFDLRGLLRANSNARASFYSTMLNLGIYSINDARKAEGLKPLGPEGDHHFVPMNVQTLEDAVKPKPQAPGLPGPSGGGGGGGDDGPPPPTPGGPPSMSEVKTGKAPIASPKGEASKPKPKMEDAIEESSADWEDAIEGRAYCPTGPGGGEDNSCSSSHSTDQQSDESGVVSIPAGHESLVNYRPFVSVGDTKNSEFAKIPDEKSVKSALNVKQQEKFGSHRELKAGYLLDLRIDINAFKNHKVYAVTAHEHTEGTGVGKALGYDTHIRLKGPVKFVANENQAQAIGQGARKGTHSTVKGAYDPSRTIPEDIDSWTPVGYDPYKTVYYYDKRTGDEIVGGTHAVSVGNTVFTTKPIYGNAKEPGKPPRNAKHDYRSLSPANQELYKAQEEIAGENGKWSQVDAHYMVNNPFSSRGIKCENCVYYEGGKCEIVSGQIYDEGVCKLWIIPEEKLSNPEHRSFCATGEGGGIDNSCGSGGGSSTPSLSIERLIEKIANNPDGFTLDPLSAESPPDGIMVSEFQNDTVRSVNIKASSIKSPEGMEKLSKWVRNNADALVGKADRFIGGWKTGDDFYIDVSTRFPPDKAAEALEAGRNAGQLAVFNLGTFKETWVKYDRDDSRKPDGYDQKYAKARKDLQEKQVYDPESPAIQDEDWAGEIAGHGKTTVRSYNGTSEEDSSDEQSSTAIRHTEQADDHRDVSSDENVLRESRAVEGQSIGPGLVRRRPGEVSVVVGGSAGSAEVREGGIDEDCGRGPGGIFGPGNHCQDSDGPSDSFGNSIDAKMRTPSSTAGGGGGRVKSSNEWKKSDTPSIFGKGDLAKAHPCRSLAGVNSVTILNGKTLAASLKETGVTLDQAAKVCGNLSPEANVTVAHGTLADIVRYMDDPSEADVTQSSVTVVSHQPFGGVKDAIGTAASLTRTDEDDLLLSYSMFSVAPEAQKQSPIAVGRELYRGVVKSIGEADKIGVTEVNMLAAGSDKNDEFKGYRIWPRLGFDGVIPRKLITPTYSVKKGFFEKYGSKLPDVILSDKAKAEKKAGALTIQSLYDTKEGQRWWEENGSAMAMSLQVGNDHDSGWQRFKKISEHVSTRDILEVLDIEWRGFRGESEERAFCPNGEGNGVTNTCGSTSTVAPQKPDTVRVDSQDRLDKAISTLGASSVDDVIALGGGNLRGSDVSIAAMPEPEGEGSAYLQVATIAPVERDGSSNETFATQVSISVGPNGKEIGFEHLGMSNHGQMTKANEQKVMSLVSEKVAESIATAEKLDFDRITTFAIGDASNGYKGYRLWPQFGFDGDIPRTLARKIPAEIVLKSKGIEIPPPGSTSIPHDLVVKSLASRYRDLTIQELIKTREGKRWWDQNGDDINLTLDLKDKTSLGYKKWQEMKDRLPALRERNQTREFFDAFAEERAFCATGEGGGILNTCSSSDSEGGFTDAFGGDIGGFARTGVAKGGKAPAEQIQRDPSSPIANPTHEAVLSPPTVRSPDGKKIESNVVSRDVPGEIYSFGGREYASTVAVGQYFCDKQAEDRGEITIDSSRPLAGDNLQYVVDAHAQQVQSAMSRGIKPVFYTPEERQKQVEEFSVMEPKILGGRASAGFEVTTENAEFIFRAVQAVTSSNASPEANMKRTQAVLDKFFNGDGRIATSTSFGVTGGAIKKSLSRLQTIMDMLGLDKTRELFMDKTMRSGDIDSFFRDAQGLPGRKNAWKPSNYLVDQNVPVFSVFGPKFGTFFANNTGNLEHLTADIWATRTFGRITGELIQQPKAEKTRSYAKDVAKLIKSASSDMLHGYDGNQLLDSLKQVAATGEMTDIVRGWSGERLRNYARGDFTEKRGVGGKLNKLAKNIVENDVGLMGTPGSGARRANMIDVYAHVSKKTGIPVAYAQDVLWQDEQDAYAAAGAKTVTSVGELSFYSDVIRKIAADPEGRFPRAKKEKRDIDQPEVGYLDDYEHGGMENTLWWDAIDGLSDKDFAEFVISTAKSDRKEPRSSIESARDAVIELRSAGLTSIVMPNAGRDGLHVMGFDAEIPSDLAEKLPESLSHCKTLLDLHVSSEGRSWWEQNGRDIDVSIDLEGVQGRIFDSFAAEKRWEDIIEEGTLDDYGTS